jgi:chemotaxis methyl-accepting protein methylase
VVRDLEYDEFLKEACPPLDLVWRKYRRRAARRRIRERMGELGISEYREYLRLLLADSGEAAQFPERVRLTLSRFFRERERWEALVGLAIPFLCEESASGPFLRVWSVGCCGGEEPYSLALLWRDRLEDRYPDQRLEITAGDIDGPSLERAKAGRYALSSLREMPPQMRRKWFRREGEGHVLSKRVKELVRFEKKNIFDAGPPGDKDLVLCRYLVFTYYRGERRRNAAGILRDALRPGGLLMIGRKEGLTAGDRFFFEPWREEFGLFKRRETVST